mmetsp:Transcript_51936/g.103361  ORF Transcript_51936/g.103361 Transcript_51936/m.103361 type:complete len:349 (-) Transcript_51936:1971-3017(-)
MLGRALASRRNAPWSTTPQPACTNSRQQAQCRSTTVSRRVLCCARQHPAHPPSTKIRTRMLFNSKQATYATHTGTPMQTGGVVVDASRARPSSLPTLIVMALGAPKTCPSLQALLTIARPPSPHTVLGSTAAAASRHLLGSLGTVSGQPRTISDARRELVDLASFRHRRSHRRVLEFDAQHDGLLPVHLIGDLEDLGHLAAVVGWDACAAGRRHLQLHVLWHGHLEVERVHRRGRCVREGRLDVGDGEVCGVLRARESDVDSPLLKSRERSERARRRRRRGRCGTQPHRWSAHHRRHHVHPSRWRRSRGRRRRAEEPQEVVHAAHCARRRRSRRGSPHGGRRRRRATH